MTNPETIAKAAARVFESLGGDIVDPPTLLPGSIPLELSGESVRQRLCIFNDVKGNEMALRPDLTLSVASLEVDARKAGRKGTYVARYNAKAFRLPQVSGDPLEFTQVGAENFGAASTPQADTEMLAHVIEASKAGGVTQARALFGDLSVFPAFIDRMDLPTDIAGALKRTFRQAGGVRTVLNSDKQSRAHGLASLLKGTSWDEADAAVQDILKLAGVQPVGARGSDEIVTRLLEKAQARGAEDIPQEARAIIEQLLELDCDIREAASALRAIAKTAGLPDLDPMIEALGKHFDTVTRLGEGFFVSAKFGPTFGRRFTYYDGCVFELSDPEGSYRQPFGAGGRYDRLILDLSGGEVSETAVGGVVRPDRLMEAAS